jgi:hypothetical protein
MMRRPVGRDTWGGLFDCALLAKAFGNGIAIATLLIAEEGHALTLGCVGAPPDATTCIVFLGWTGNHYVRIRLRRDDMARFKAWRVSDS